MVGIWDASSISTIKYPARALHIREVGGLRLKFLHYVWTHWPRVPVPANSFPLSIGTRHVNMNRIVTSHSPTQTDEQITHQRH
jgi:hypothetical protein